jgi:1-deoxy-D-xylulose-5-phosphate reductoisomerase
MKKIAILGSTGSIGTQALEVIQEHPDQFEVEVITAGGNIDLLISQAKKYRPNVVVIEKEEHYSKLQEALESLDIQIYAGKESSYSW